ncbi:helix-turn-helix domain-containing protein [Candidatus Nanohalobium constans]|uniref:TrmB family transcriptional regulator n=1 Tax=Candidatus Nanohalobium constans TaxID=2565781 RepID=A0A5Q0UHA9_9ARCH|nr:helix-turn-helix domain-containing protein [Candidatus Nanohalobium constans]QGA81028.1 TrmB family transcriptional regulator [Candidatus Nanohalobium constans]
MDFLEVGEKDDRQIIFDVFDLNGLQKSIFRELQDNKLTVQELAEEVDRNRSTVQRSLQEMMDKDLLMREGRTEKTVYYVYTTLPIEDLRELTCEVVQTWASQVEEKLD